MEVGRPVWPSLSQFSCNVRVVDKYGIKRRCSLSARHADRPTRRPDGCNFCPFQQLMLPALGEVETEFDKIATVGHALNSNLVVTVFRDRLPARATYWRCPRFHRPFPSARSAAPPPSLWCQCLLIPDPRRHPSIWPAAVAAAEMSPYQRSEGKRGRPPKKPRKDNKRKRER